MPLSVSKLFKYKAQDLDVNPGCLFLDRGTCTEMLALRLLTLLGLRALLLRLLHRVRVKFKVQKLAYSSLLHLKGYTLGGRRWGDFEFLIS